MTTYGCPHILWSQVTLVLNLFQAIREEVVESKLTTASASKPERPVSRFKAARMASKR